MAKYEFAQSSIDYLKDVDERLSRIMYRAKELSEIDFDISCGYRSEDEQYKLFLQGRSQLDGLRYKSKHNYKPALGVDLYAYNGKYADYSEDKMKYLSGIIKCASAELKVNITWGGDWIDFMDMPHYELDV